MKTPTKRASDSSIAASGGTVRVNPFPGPKAYREDQEHYFFGRTEEIEELTSLVLSSSATLLYAPSGAGKSSLLHAGVGPHLEHRFDFILLPTVQVGRGTRTKVAEGAANQFVQVVCEAISDGDAPTPHDIAAAAWSRRPDARRVLLILDQFEEVFDDPVLWRDRKEFFTALTRALEENTWLRVIIALRSDYLADLVPYERYLPDNLVVRYQLDSLSEEQAEQAIASAFAASGVGLPDAVLHAVLDALLQDPPSQAGIPPIRAQYVNTVQLQIACRRLWEELNGADGSARPPELSQASLSLSSSMMHFVDEAIAEAVGRDRAGEAAVRWWLNEHLITPTGRRAFVLVGEEVTAGLPNAVVEALEDVRLIQLEQRHRSRLVELTHDSMVEGVRASNEARARKRYRQDLRRRGVLAALLAGLLILFPVLRSNTLQFRSGSVEKNGEARESFPGGAKGGIVVELAAKQPLALRIEEDRRGPDDLPPLVHQLIPPDRTRSTTVAFPTKPDSVYTAVLTNLGTEDVRYGMTLTPAPVMREDKEVLSSISSPRVIIQLQPGRREFIRTEDGELITGTITNRKGRVAGAQPLVLNDLADWAIIEGTSSSSPPTSDALIREASRYPGSAGAVVLTLKSELSQDSPEAATVRREFLDESDQVPVGQSLEITVDRSAVEYVPLERSQPIGAKVRCADPVSVQIIGGSLGRARAVGSKGDVLPIITGPMPSYLVLHDYYGKGPIECSIDVQPRKEIAVTAFGRQDLVVPESSSTAAFPLTLPRDAVLIADRPNDITPSLQCGSQVERPSTDSPRFLAFAPASSSCVLWLEKNDPSTGATSLPVWIDEVSDAGGR